jgi:diguanylate cyclase (GGDEF)-like protein
VSPPEHSSPTAAAALARAWELSYLDPKAAGALGRRLATSGGALAAQGWLHVGLAEVRAGDDAAAQQALARARAAWAALGEDQPAGRHGLALVDEVLAIHLRRIGDYEGSARLQAAIDERIAALGIEYDAMQRFLAHNSRAITAKLLGRVDQALHHCYAAVEAAEATGWDGPRITALSNLGGYHQDLYNLEDARTLSEQALAAARKAGVKPVVATAASNLIIIHHAAGDTAAARAMADFLVGHPDELVSGVLERYALPLALAHLGVGELDEAERYLEAGAVGAIADGDGMTFWGWLRARCLLARGHAAAAREVAEQILLERRERRLSDQPYDLMELHRVLADACERLEDTRAALACVRHAQALYEQLVGRSARARYTALQVSHQLAQARRERDRAVDSRRSAEDDRRRLAELNAALQAQVAQTERLHAQLREQALRDPLTGLHNRRYLFETAPAMLELARRQGQVLAVVLIDLDHFKLINDTYGHAAGDAVLQRFGSLLGATLRRSDLVCRHGGEEFVALMPETDGDAAQALLSRLLDAFQELPPDTAPGRRRLPGASFSAGVVLFPRHGHTLEQLLSRADRALYAAKHQGRARIEQAPRTGFGSLV